MPTPHDALHALLDSGATLSLATLDDGAPAISLAPYVALRGPVRLYILVSELAAHTAALRADARCAWMVHEAPREGDATGAHALARVTAKATARFITRDEASALGVEARYRARHPVAETLLGLKDFHFCELSPTEGAALVLGFGRAYRVTGADLDVVEHVRGR